MDGEVQSKKILLVDDDPAVSFITQRLFRQATVEAEVLLASNGQEALDIITEVCQREQCLELILLDINMPVMDGFEFLEKLRKSADLSAAALRIVVLSSSTHYLDRVRAKNYPVIGFIEKPLTMEKLYMFL